MPTSAPFRLPLMREAKLLLDPPSYNRQKAAGILSGGFCRWCRNNQALRLPRHDILTQIFTKINSKYLCCYILVWVINMNYIIRMRNLREDHDKTQQQIANVLGTSQTMYARYERGANEMPIRHLLTLCDYYNVSADYLLGRTDKKQ